MVLVLAFVRHVVVDLAFVRLLVVLVLAFVRHVVVDLACKGALVAFGIVQFSSPGLHVGALALCNFGIRLAWFARWHWWLWHCAIFITWFARWHWIWLLALCNFHHLVCKEVLVLCNFHHLACKVWDQTFFNYCIKSFKI